MGKCVNKVILLGHAGKDPQAHILPSGTLVNLSLATSSRYKDNRGEWQERTEWHSLVGYQQNWRDPSRLCQERFANLR